MQTHFSGVLTHTDAQRNIPHSVDIPAGARELRVTLVFTPERVAGVRNMITLSVFDPRGFRGAGHRGGTRHEVCINANGATPGYIAGEITAGRWTITLDTHMIMAGEPCAYVLTIDAIAEAGALTYGLPNRVPPAPKAHPSSRGPGWYRGDLHAHTLHSDASWPVDGLLAWAREQRLDFVSLTDHNTTAPLAAWDALTDDGILTIGGQELTTFYGHAVALGAREWIDWRSRAGEQARGIEDIAADVRAAGGLFVMAHPMSIGNPYCTGCRWVYRDMMPGSARVIEIWNSGWSGSNEDAMDLVFGWLNKGYKLALTSGTDNHGPLLQPEQRGYNVVYAKDRTERDILRAIAAGHSYLSAGPRLTLTARHASGAQAMMGDVLPPGEVEIKAAWNGCEVEDQISLIVDGLAHEALPAINHGEHHWHFAAGNARWCLLTIRNPDGVMRALSNPIFISQ